jgi:hypothetical protein
MDVDDVAAGHQTKQRWNDPSEWVWSSKPSHEPLVSLEDFDAVRAQMAAGAHRPTVRKGTRKARPYPLSGLVRCAACERRMAGQWTHGIAYYRCRYPAEYALANKVDHPKTVYVKESSIIPKLDAWIAELFDPANVEATCEALAVASETDEAADARTEAARRKLADCDRRLTQYRAALDSGGPVKVLAGYMSEVEGDRLRALRELEAAGSGPAMSKAQVAELVAQLQDVASVLADADPQLKAQAYADLGVSITFEPGERVVIAQMQPCATGGVGEGT